LGNILCEQCTAACCRYVSLPIDKPTRARDYDDIRWYLLHEHLSVFVEDGDWYLQIQTPCRHIGPDNLCQVYETRPEICREYQPKDCDYAAGPYQYEHHFTHAEQIEAYYEKRTGKKLPTTVPSHGTPVQLRTKKGAKKPSPAPR
jgi:Fe-S-cluster containining protein